MNTDGLLGPPQRGLFLPRFKTQKIGRNKKNLDKKKKINGPDSTEKSFHEFVLKLAAKSGPWSRKAKARESACVL